MTVSKHFTTSNPESVPNDKFFTCFQVLMISNESLGFAYFWTLLRRKWLIHYLLSCCRASGFNFKVALDECRVVTVFGNEVLSFCCSIRRCMVTRTIAGPSKERPCEMSSTNGTQTGWICSNYRNQTRWVAINAYYLMLENTAIWCEIWGMIVLMKNESRR